MKCVCLENTELIGNLREKPDPNFNHPSHFLDVKHILEQPGLTIS